MISFKRVVNFSGIYKKAPSKRPVLHTEELEMNSEYLTLSILLNSLDGKPI